MARLDATPDQLVTAAWEREPGRPVIGWEYTAGGGATCTCLACGPTHVVVKWPEKKEGRRSCYTREEFAQEFSLAFGQPDLFGA